MVIADTSVWVDFFRGNKEAHSEALVELLEAQEIGLCDRVLQEVLQGVLSDADWRRVSDKLLALPCFNLGGAALAVAAARNYRRLRRLGITPRSATDVLIATFCAEAGYALLHNDRDFDLMAQHVGMKVAATGA